MVSRQATADARFAARREIIIRAPHDPVTSEAGLYKREMTRVRRRQSIALRCPTVKNKQPLRYGEFHHRAENRPGLESGNGWRL